MFFYVCLLSKLCLGNFVSGPEIFAFLHIRDLMLQIDAIAYWRLKCVIIGYAGISICYLFAVM